jgi:lysophospholipase L1-like esterase
MKIAPFVIAIFAVHTLLANPKLEGKWVATWVTSQQSIDAYNSPPAPGLQGNTLRQIIQPTLGGNQARITFSNLCGEGPLTINGATIARSSGQSAIAANSIVNLTFNGEPSAVVPPGAALTSDPVTIEVRAFENLVISTYCVSVPATITGHPGSRTTSFIQAGNCVAMDELKTAAVTDHWYFLAEIDVQAADSAAAILVLGDSITDGRGSTTNKNDRWTDNLARRLHANPRTATIAVLNQGVGGNRVLRNGLGPSALQRFDRDVLLPAGVRWVIVFEGINDLGTAVTARVRNEPAATAQDITNGYEQMIAKARAHGLRIYGATITPFQGFVSYYNSQSEGDRQAVNHWIRTSGKFDGVIDFDEITRDRENTLKLSSSVDGGDHLHPSAEGYKVMAEGIDLDLFTER